MNMGLFGRIGGLGSFGTLGGPGSGGGGPIPFIDVGGAFGGNGDSIINRGNFFTSTIAENRQNSEMNWVNFLYPSLVTRNWYDPTATTANLVPAFAEASATNPLWRGLNLGLQGDTSTGGTRRDDKIAAISDLIFDAFCTNQGAADDAPTAIAMCQERFATYRAFGVPFIIGAPRPRGVVESGAVAPIINTSQMLRIIAIRDWMAANWQAEGAVGYYDPWEVMRDHAFPPGHPRYGQVAAGITIDQVHLSPIGAYVGAVFGGLLNIVRSVVKPGFWFEGLNNPLPAFTGIGGNPAGGVDGVIPTGWACLNAQGDGQPVTVIASIEGEEVILDISSSGAGAVNSFNTVRFQLSTTTFNTGLTSTDWLVAVHPFEVVTPSPIFAMFENVLGQGSTASARGMSRANGAFNSEPSPATLYPMKGWICSEPLLYDTRTSVSPRLDMNVRQDLLGGGRVKLGRPWLVKIPNPSVAYPFEVGTSNGYYNVRPAGAGSTATTEVLGTGRDGFLQYVDVKISSITTGFEWGSIELLPTLANVVPGTLVDMTCYVKKMDEENLAFLVAQMGVSQLDSSFVPVPDATPSLDFVPGVGGLLVDAETTHQFTLAGTDLTYGMPYLFFGSSEAAPWSVTLRIHVDTPVVT